MKKDDLIKWAIKGISAEIDEKEKTIHQGQRYIKAIEAGEKVNTPMTKTEIQAVIYKLNNEIEALSKELFDLKWELSFDETYEL